MHSDTPLTKIKLLISAPDDIGKADFAHNGAVADIFDSEGNAVVPPVHLAEKLHPDDVFFRLDAGSPKLAEQFREMAKLGCMGFENYGILLSGLRDMDGLYRARIAAQEAGLNPGVNARLGILVEHPSLAMLYDDLGKNGPSFIMLDLDRLQERMLGKTGEMPSGIHPSVMRLVAGIGKTCRRSGIPLGASGKLLKSRSAVASLINHGIDFLAAAPEDAKELGQAALHAEKKREIDFLAEKMRMNLGPGRG